MKLRIRLRAWRVGRYRRQIRDAELIAWAQSLIGRTT